MDGVADTKQSAAMAGMAGMNGRSSPLAVVGTNSSSIGSKRAAERQGYFLEDQHLRHFVPRPVRRAPLISLGYTIRSNIIDRTITGFLSNVLHNSDSDAVAVVNLGAGTDPSFFRIASRPADPHRPLPSLVWIDVDFPNLVQAKAALIAQTPQLSRFVPSLRPDSVGTLHVAAGSDVSARYGLLGCDLCQTERFLSLLSSLLPSPSIPVLFVSEVATVYQPAHSSTALLAGLARTFPRSTYVCLEQCVPHRNLDNGFTSTMFHHFARNVHTPLWGTLRYPTVEDQVRRLLDAGWADGKVATMLDIWHASCRQDVREAARLTTVEAFDEWEELDYFLSHYYFAIATTALSPLATASPVLPSLQPFATFAGPTAGPSSSPIAASRPAWSAAPSVGQLSRRGHTCTTLADGRQFVFGGFGTAPSSSSTGSKPSGQLHLRLSHPLLVGFPSSSGTTANLYPIPVTADTPPAKIYHSAVRIDSPSGSEVAIFGGRSGPRTPFGDLHLFSPSTLLWTRIDPSSSDEPRPLPRFRHVAVAVPRADGYTDMLVHGGIDGSGRTLDDAWALDGQTHRWRALEKYGRAIGPRHSHAACVVDGYLHVFGGKLPLDLASTNPSHIAPDVRIPLPSTSDVEPASERSSAQSGRYGSRVLPWPSQPGHVMLCGGMTAHGPPRPSELFQLVDVSPASPSITNLAVPLPPSRCLVDHTLALQTLNVDAVGGGKVHAAVLMGGGATCFSFGSKFDSDISILTDQSVSPFRISEQPSAVANGSSNKANGEGSWSKPTPIDRIHCPSEEAWHRALSVSRPCVFSGLSIGPCTDLWTPSYLRAKAGHRNVSTHVASTSPTLRWHDKNFRYQTMSFSDLVGRTLQVAPANTQGEGPSETVYLRSLSASPKKPARLDVDFPEIASDFSLPDPLRSTVEARFFSSPLRISGPETTMWAHYDASDNVLVQVRGRKLVRLWHPRDVDRLYVEGSSSVIPDVQHPDLDRFPLYRSAQPFDTILEPGDILLIPALWLHSTKCLSDDGSVSVNVFFRSQPTSVYPATDVWSNQDLVPFAEAQQGVAAAVQALDGLPTTQRAFYLKKLGLALLKDGEGLAEMSNGGAS